MARRPRSAKKNNIRDGCGEGRPLSNQAARPGPGRSDETKPGGHGVDLRHRAWAGVEDQPAVVPIHLHPSFGVGCQRQLDGFLECLPEGRLRVEAAAKLLVQGRPRHKDSLFQGV